MLAGVVVAVLLVSFVLGVIPLEAFCAFPCQSPQHPCFALLTFPGILPLTVPIRFVTNTLTLIPGSLRPPHFTEPSPLRPPNYYLALPPRLPALKLAEPWTLHVLLYPQLFFQFSNLSLRLQLGVGVQPVCPQLEACPLGQPFLSLLCGGSPCAVPQTNTLRQPAFWGFSPDSLDGPQASNIRATLPHIEVNGQVGFPAPRMSPSQGPFLRSPGRLNNCWLTTLKFPR